jgi:plastocyanin
MRHTRPFALVILAAALILVAAACGSSSKGATAKPAAGGASTTVPEVTPATQIIADSVPAGATRVHLETGPFPITPGQNNIGFTRSIPQPTQDGWIVGISTNLRLADGSIPPVDVIHLHHGVWLNLSGKDATSPGLPERFFAAGEEKTRMILPTGYGYQYKASDHWLLNYMLHNQLSKPSQVWVTYDIDLIPASSAAAKTIKPAIPVWMDVQNGSTYPVFDVAQGSGTNGQYTYPDDAKDPYDCSGNASCTPKNEWKVPYDGTLLATAGHVHPGGLHDDLWDTRPGATGVNGHTKTGSPDTAHLFSSVASYFEPAGNVSWDVAMSGTPADWRVAVHKGDTLSITTTYDSKTASWYESMGIMVVWMAVGDTTGANPFTTPTDVQGVLTHGHLSENNNHGGAPDPADFEDVTKLPSRVVPSGTVLPISDFAYVGDMSETATVPTVVQGGYLVFRNDDASKGIPHTITACMQPCDGKTGVAFPLANGQPQFDSGELARFGPPSSGKITWSTPTDLPPGTYTYYCRIHPFMRGAFRVVAKPS